MSSDRWQRVEKIFERAIELEKEERASYLDHACAGDPDLRREVEELLVSDGAQAHSLTNLVARAADRAMAPAGAACDISEDLTGTRIGPYQITSRIGAGGMGVVYQARDTQLDRTVAIKVLTPALVQDADRRRRFIREAKTASALNHPNIVTIHTITQAKSVDCIVMEFVAGQALDQSIGRKGLGLPETLKYAIQMASALTAAHAAGVVHRDLKPANIMVTESGLVKVLDFGLAKLTEPNPREGSEALKTDTTQERTIFGTPAYMSPEQAEGKRVDARSDIFSFGAVLYQMITGLQPFRGDSASSTLANVLSREPTPPSQLARSVPPELERIILRCLRKDPTRRFQHIGDVKIELEELKELTDSGAQENAGSVSAGWRTRSVLWSGLFLLALLTAAGIFYFLERAPSGPPAMRVVPLTSYQGAAITPTLSPDGNQVAFSWNGEAQDNYHIYVKVVGSSAPPLRLTSHPGGDLYPAWSPDSRQIAFVRTTDRGARLCLISALGGSERNLIDLPMVTNGPPSWSSNGKWLSFDEGLREGSRGISAVSVETGEKRMLTSNSAGLDVSPAFSPDGRSLAYVSCPGRVTSGCDVYVRELTSDLALSPGARRVTDQQAMIQALAWTSDSQTIIYSVSRCADDGPFDLWRVDPAGTQAPARIDLAGLEARYPSAARASARLVYARRKTDASDIWRYQPGKHPDRFLSSSLNEINPQFSPDGKRIAFQSSRGGGCTEIWVSDPDGSNALQLTNGLGRLQGTPRWSPDGRFIAFDSLRLDGGPDIYVIDADGGGLRCLTPFASNESVPSWSRDGKWVYFRSDRTGRSEIWKVPFQGGEALQVTDNGGRVVFASRDGETLYYMKIASTVAPLYARAVSGGAERRIIEAVLQRAFYPVEDGIYYMGPGERPGESALRFYRFASQTTETLTSIEQHVSLGLTVSPDRKTFLFSVSNPASSDLMLIENFR
jgi:serine/threonine protein kinase